MPLVRNEQQKALYKYAVENNFTIPAMHMSGIGSMKAILDGAQEVDSPIIIQLFEYSYWIFEPLNKFIKYFEDVCKDYTIPIVLNHDHNSSVEGCKWAVDVGLPSIMFDGSRLPFEENIAKTKEIVDYAHAKGVVVEAELGSIPGFEHMVMDSSSYEYTIPEKAAEFVQRTGVDCLAVSVGTAHGGVRAEKNLEIDFDRLAAIREAVGPEFPLVLHGAASLPETHINECNKWGGKAEQLMMCREETIKKACNYGICKANMDVDNMLVVTASIRKSLVENPGNYNQQIYYKESCDAFKEEVIRKAKDVTCSAGKASGFKY